MNDVMFPLGAAVFYANDHYFPGRDARALKEIISQTGSYLVFFSRERERERERALKEIISQSDQHLVLSSNMVCF